MKDDMSCCSSLCYLSVVLVVVSCILSFRSDPIPERMVGKTSKVSIIPQSSFEKWSRLFIQVHPSSG